MKDHIRDYATEAFRFYAKNGKSADKYREKIYNQALEEIKKREGSTGISCPTESAIIRAENAVDEKLAEIKDMEAVEMTLAELKGIREPFTIKAIEIVYFKDCDKTLEKGDIKSRVAKAGIEINADERSIYRWLKKARDIFAYQRGLRLKKIS